MYYRSAKFEHENKHTPRLRSFWFSSDHLGKYCDKPSSPSKFFPIHCSPLILSPIAQQSQIAEERTGASYFPSWRPLSSKLQILWHYVWFMTFLRKYTEPRFFARILSSLLPSTKRKDIWWIWTSGSIQRPVFYKNLRPGSANLSFARHVIYDRLFGRTLHIERSYGRKKHRKYMSWGSWSTHVLEYVLQHINVDNI